jgi:hypothetical protein
LCDWECFRDPSELFGPLLSVFSAPLSLIRKMRSDRDYFSVWLDDLRYYRACDFFDGRRPPDFARLSAYGRRTNKGASRGYPQLGIYS